ncbi:P-loop containing nucleoside triphosphate hydrolase protein [Coniochaeta ligniaria NRRL 30616]|uniref:p-loop containing nucleoside triphosphate hydrolase protein n=1 Tax=Coniochaeta ligniaria NRRL 30616 TaxID=1408157 RepID=A0A1J7IDX6_9PEZI|nr:P-loop containing nucleoside triphosphate hydrolase protein [Coniochaeta ligniaria NRRL 30616]
MQNNTILLVVGTGVAVIGLCSVPAAASLVLQLTRKEKNDNRIYEDADGKATPESAKAFSAKPAKALVLLFAAVGTALSIVLPVCSVRGQSLVPEDWMSLAAWVALLFQAIAIVSSRKSVQAYDLGIYTFFSAIALSCILLAQDIKLAEKLLHDNKLFFSLRAIEFATAILLAISGLAIPRRPDVYFNGELVDRMYTVSAFSRFTWSWPHDILSLAKKKKNLDMVDLTRPDHETRAVAVSEDWKRKNYRYKLWISLLLAHKKAFAIQWILTLVTSFLNFAPQWVILQLLRILESRHPGDRIGPEVWIWAVWLGVVIIAQSWVECYVFWLSWAQLTIPVRAQLSALIFEKAMRKKDVKGTGKSSNKATVQESAEPNIAGPSTGSTVPEAPVVEEETDASEEIKKSKQGTVNLIGVDGKRVSDFCAYQNMFPGSLFKLIVSLVFLVSLLGWLPLLAGFSAMLAIMPINVYFSKKYAAAQDRLMKVRDEKLEVVTEALQGIRQIKFSALEPEWEKKVGGVREKELKCVWDVFMSDTLLIACWVTSPILLSAISLAVYAALQGTLTPSVAFVSLGIFKALEMTLSVVPELTTDLLDAWVSIKRIEQYLNSPEIAEVTKHAPEVTFDSATIAWPADDEIDDSERFVLRDINVKFPEGELSVISGKTGTGKSLMLAAILGEVDVLGGNLYVPRVPSLHERHDSKANKSNWIIPGAVAYVAQIPWIENASIKDNILFGLPYDEERYIKTVEVCALKKDLDMLSDGEDTEIGANGINLSGGQKWRVTLARAVYSRAGILVLDDIFSAVDAHVGRHIFEKCLNGELAQGRTRILVTHHVALCQPKTKYLVELGDGGVLHSGLLSELEEDGTLEQIKSQVESQQDIEADEAPTAVNSDDSTDGEQENAEGDTLKKVTSKSTARKFVEEETREQGSVRKHVYYTYLRDSGGWGYWITAFFVFTIVQVFTVGRSWWLKIWTGNEVAEQSHDMHIFNHSREHGFSWAVGVQQTSIHTLAAPSTQGQHSLNFYLSIYVLLAVMSSLVGTFRFFYVYLGSIKASRRLFEKLNFVILRAPLRWLDTVPVGRILNRFTADFHIIDSQLANSISFGAGSFLGLIGVIVAGLFVSPWIVLLAAVLLVICLYYAAVYLNGARPVKRLESTTKSPVFEQFGSALTGVSTIRGFDKAQVYLERMYRKIDDYSTATWHLWLFNRWMGWRMSLVGSFFASFVSIFILMTPGIDSALAGFALAFALEFSSCVMWTIRLYANVELNMNAAERIIEYTELPTESLEGINPPAAWPTRGIIEVEDLVVGYAADLPPVLKGLSFSVNSNERVGVVGRTGAGKSSLTLALFRFLEARSGTIHIDGLDISKIKLHDLRSRLAIIPQDPVLFSGTIRSNLDPFDNHTDAALRDCLERVHLISSSTAATSGTATPVGVQTPPEHARNANVFQNLSSPISEGGLNLSQGQRQLLCLARAIVSRPRVMVLDEATSAVDMHTDALIQRSIREEFTDSTLLVIAHRLSTIADFDRILVLSDGMVAEYGTPKELWEKEGVFRGMCEESGERDKLRGIVFGTGGSK